MNDGDVVNVDTTSQKDLLLELARKIVLVGRRQREALKNFNIFSICGVDHYENRHSQILKTFLDPKGSHGLGAVFLDEFFKMLDVSFRITDRTQVVTELSTDYGRMDICIIDEAENWCVVIENKVYANEQDRQLTRYAKFLERFEKSKLFFLTRTGHKSQTDAGGCSIPISYGKDIITWLNRCIGRSLVGKENRPIVTEVLKQYIIHIQTITENTMVTQEKIELIKEAKTDFVNFQNKCDYYKVMEEVRSQVIQEIQQDIMAGVAQKVADKCLLEKDGFIDELKIEENTGFIFSAKDIKLKIRVSAASVGCDDIFVGVLKDESKGCWRKILSRCANWSSDTRWKWKYCDNKYKSWNALFYQKCQDESSFRAQVEDEIAKLILEAVAAAV